MFASLSISAPEIGREESHSSDSHHFPHITGRIPITMDDSRGRVGRNETPRTQFTSRVSDVCQRLVPYSAPYRGAVRLAPNSPPASPGARLASGEGKAPGSDEAGAERPFVSSSFGLPSGDGEQTGRSGP